MFKRLISLLLAVMMVMLSAFCVSADGTDNSSLLEYRTGSDAELRKQYSSGVIETPGWVDSLIMVEVRPDTASIGGTFAESYDLLDYYASVGVNGIWLAPVYDRGDGGNGYSNLGPHTIEPALTGRDNYEEGWQELRKFIDHAHSKGIYVFLDVITWGVLRGAPLITEHPDWFSGEAWGNIAFDWSNEELYDWFVETLVKNVTVTGADGLRCDCEPHHSGYDMYGEVRQRLHESGKDIVIISEDYSKRSGTYDFEQDGVLDFSTHSRETLYKTPVNFFADGYLNIVDSVKSGNGEGYPDWQGTLKAGTGRYYTNCITNHDYQSRNVCGSRVKIGYSAIFAPYIPIWYMGDEFNAYNEHGVLYDMPVDFSEMYESEKAAFLEDVKKMIEIRRTYTDIFEYWPVNHRNSNICKVQTEGLGTLQAYARYADNMAVLVVANNSTGSVEGTVTVPFSKCGISYYGKYKVTELMSGKVIAEGTKEEIKEFTAEVQTDYVAAYLVEGSEPTSPILIKISQFFRLLPDKLFSVFF